MFIVHAFFSVLNEIDITLIVGDYYADCGIIIIRRIGILNDVQDLLLEVKFNWEHST